MSFSEVFFQRAVRIGEEGKLVWLKDGQIGVGKKNVVKKVEEVSLAKLIVSRSLMREREIFLNNIRCLSVEGLEVKIDSYDVLERFLGAFSCETFGVEHLSTHPKSDGVPTDHFILKEEKRKFSLVICDGLGHHDPKNIARVAAHVARVLCDRGLGANPEDYLRYLNELNSRFQTDEGTCVLHAEVTWNKESVELCLGQFGDSNLVVIDSWGSIVQATENLPDLLIKGSDKVGMLAVGGGFSSQLLKHAVWKRVSLIAKRYFVLAGSDGFFGHFYDAQGHLLTSKLNHALATGQWGECESISLDSELTVTKIHSHLSQALQHAARCHPGENNHFLDDVTLVVAKVDPS